MKIKDYKCKCGKDDFYMYSNGNQTGICCSCCGKFLKWASKDEKKLKLKQNTLIDNIQSEINNLPTYLTKFRDDKFIIQIEKSKVDKILEHYRIGD